MNKAGAHKVLTLELTPYAGGVAVAMRSRGPADPLAVAKGAAFESALDLVSLLFPVCPRAHQAAALNAAESLAGLKLSPGQKAARALLVYAEAIVGCIMRHDLVWPRELGRAPFTEDCRKARGASQALEKALFEGAWARPGGGALRLQNHAAQHAVGLLIESAGRAAGRARDMLADMPGFSVEAQHLGIAFDRGAIVPAPADIDPGAEETPRTLHASAAHDGVLSVANWFDAQINHLDWLAHGLSPLLKKTTEEAAPAAAPGPLSGTGFGVAMTARGRLRHALTLQDGAVRDWKSLAPTDLNFAANGPVSQLARALSAGDDLKANANWLVQAFDPCTPCEVLITTERRHA